MNDLITRILATWPAEIAAMAYAVSMMAPIVLVLYGLWLVADLVEWLIDYTERKRLAQHKRTASGPAYRTASERQLERDVANLWRRHPGFEDTYPPDAESSPARRRQS